MLSVAAATNCFPSEMVVAIGFSTSTGIPVTMSCKARGSWVLFEAQFIAASIRMRCGELSREVRVGTVLC